MKDSYWVQLGELSGDPSLGIVHTQSTRDLLPGDPQKGAIVTHLFVPQAHRRHGVGRSLMDQVCYDADREDITLYLEVIPDSPHDPNMANETELTQFYQSLNFESHRWGFMVRRPRPIRRAMPGAQEAVYMRESDTWP